MTKLTHINATGEAHMVDVSDKAETRRLARARGRVVMAPETLALAMAGEAKKGDVFGVARIAGLVAAKKTSDLIPLCHPLPLSSVKVDITPDPDLPGVHVVVETLVTGKTGVEMEALTAVSVACLTIYDMLKAVDRGMRIEGVELVAKEGGKSGVWRRD
jgi:cyclic pyranopterin phosphate synthase